MSIEVLVPCRAGSTRAPGKNTRPFAGRSDGMLGIKLEQLEALAGIDLVVVDSNDAAVLEIATRRRAGWRGHAELMIRERPAALGTSETTTDALISHALAGCQAEHLLWTHVTSPLAGTRVYERALRLYAAAVADGGGERNDSLMSVTPLMSFVWNEARPVNYQPAMLRWPRTQDLRPLYEVNSAVFMVPVALGRALGDRIGQHPLLMPMGRIEAFDVDWEEDFRLAELAYQALGDAT